MLHALVVAIVALVVPLDAVGTTVAYVPPVDAPITDPFRPPDTPYGPGNRGLEYGTAPGTVVTAAADGRAVFVGAVAGSLYVTLLHADGLRSTYSYLTDLQVAVGETVLQGAAVGVTTERPFFFSIRDPDGRYLDPALLFAEAPLRVWLVPEDAPTSPARAAPTAPLATAPLLALRLVRAGLLRPLSPDIWPG